MSKQYEVKLTKVQQRKVLSMFNGNKKRKGVKSAHTIASNLSVPRHYVMYFLETEGLRSYSESSYY